MIWFWLALVAAALWGIGNIIDKHIINEVVKNPLTILMFGGPFYSVFAVILYFLNQGPLTKILIFPFVLGFLNTVAVLLYFKALEVEEASRVVSLTYTMPVFVLIFAAVFLGERLAPLKYVGIFLVVAGAMAIGLKRIENIMRFSPAILLAICSAVLWGIIDTGEKWAVGILPYSQVVMAVFFGCALSASLLWVSRNNRKTFSRNFKFSFPVLMILASSTIAIFAWFIFLYALISGPVSLVAAIAATQPLFVLVFAVIMTLFAPKILKEEIGKGTLSLKIIAVILIVAGAVLIGG